MSSPPAPVELPTPGARAQPESSRIRPKLRGVIHQWAFVLAVAASAALIATSATMVSGLAALTTSIYSAAVLGTFGVSTLYHRWPWRAPSAWQLMRRLDHSMIFLFIAGTYTPIAVFALPATTAVVVLAVIWGGALAGVVLKLRWPDAPRWLGVPIYLALGWVAVFVLPDLLANVGVAGLVLLLAGGVLYTLGAIGYALRRPDPWPETFGYHEVFHALTVLAAACHYVAIWFAVI